jgi:transposase
MRYTKQQFDAEFGSEDKCLQALFDIRYGDMTICPNCGAMDTKFFRLKGRKCYSCMHCRHQLHPLAGTIFHKSSTPLTSWLYAIYLFSVAKNGVAALELQRHLGCTYKTAHRMCRQIRSLMGEHTPIGGEGVIIEADETYIGGRSTPQMYMIKKKPVLGAVERGGRVRAIVTATASRKTVQQFITSHVAGGTELHTDESRLYNWARRAYIHHSINHGNHEYARGHITTNTIEGFWSQLKRSISGTYHYVSPQHLQLYVDEFAYRYSHRGDVLYPMLLELAARPVSKVH